MYLVYGIDTKSAVDRIAGSRGAVPMHDLTLARLIHEDRQREIERNLRVRAFREAQEQRGEDTLVPPEPPTRITHPLRPASSGERSL